MTDRVELTWMIDIATAHHPGGGAAADDQGGGRGAAAGQAMTPEPMRPGWPDALRMSRSVLPHRRLAEHRRAAGARGGPAGDRPGDDRVRPRHGLHVAGRSGTRAGRWASTSSPPTRARPGRRARSSGASAVGRHAVRPVRRRLCRPQRRAARQERGRRRGLVDGRAAGPARRVDRRGLAEPPA